MTPAPVHPIDMTPFREGGPAERRAVAAAVDTACRDTGFLVVTGHGVPESLRAGVLDAFEAFFDLPLEEKRRWVVADESANRGYSEPGKEGLAYSRGESTPPDLFEAFNVGREDAVGDYYERHREFYAPNVWPPSPAGLREAWLAYEEATAAFAEELLQALALALALPEGWFVERCGRAIVTTRAVNYERRPGTPDPRPAQMRMGAHTDYGVMTILLADDVAGLEICRNGTWHPVAVPEGAFVVNIGDMLERWTNGRWTSTLHRVVPPAPDRQGAARRRSIARFLDCEPDLIVECIPTCCSGSNPPRYPPVVAGEWLRAKVAGGRTMAAVDLPAGVAGT